MHRVRKPTKAVEPWQNPVALLRIPICFLITVCHSDFLQLQVQRERSCAGGKACKMAHSGYCVCLSWQFNKLWKCIHPKWILKTVLWLKCNLYTIKFTWVHYLASFDKCRPLCHYRYSSVQNASIYPEVSPCPLGVSLLPDLSAPPPDNQWPDFSY